MINLNNISLHFGQRQLFDNISYQINQGDRIGLVGKNGAGKSTLLKLINGEVTPDSGQISFQGNIKLGFLTQDIEDNVQGTVREYVSEGKKDITRLEKRIDEIGRILANSAEQDMKLYDELADLHHQLDIMDADNLDKQVTLILRGLGFKEEEIDQPLAIFSGGWQMRAVLAKLLINKPDVLLLDEPTNHLDIHSINWLEKYLRNYNGAMMLVSHDRRFLDNTITKTLEISGASIREYNTNYSNYLIKREEILEQNRREYENQQKHIKKTEELIDRFKAKNTKASFAQSLVKKLDKMDKVELEEVDKSTVNLKFPTPVKSGKVVLKCKGVSKSYEVKSVIEQSDLEIERNDKLALVGENGSGKSTLIKMITGDTDFEGDIELGHNVKMGYFAQDSQEDLDPNKTVFQTIDDIAVGDVRKQVRTILGSFLFSGEDVEKKVKVLSGGEKTRLALCKLMLEPYNFLILDEPTNHLDIQSKEILQKALREFEGTALVVSHDREFVSGLTEHLIHISNKKIKHYHYGVDEYLDKYGYSENEERKTSGSSKSTSKDTDDQISYKERKKIKNRISKLERDINKLEKENETLKAKVNDVSPDEQQKMFEKFEEIEGSVMEMMEEWERLTSKIGDH